MRTKEQMLFQAANPDMPVSELASEMVEMGVSDEKSQMFAERVARAGILTAGQIMKLSKSALLSVCAGCLEAHDIQISCMLLGSMGTPHEPGLDGQVQDAQQPEARSGTLAVVPAPGAGAVVPKDGMKVKGGELKPVAEMLETRRAYLMTDEYYPPPAFDKYHYSMPKTDPWGLRKLIVQEMLEMCGDLYPTRNECSIILTAIEQFTGYPPGGGHLDNWADHKKHKGTSVSDLQKARRDPASYGVSGHRVPGRMRPARPRRAGFAPPSARLAGPHPSISPETVKETETVAREHSDEQVPALGDLDDLDDAEALRAQVVELSTELREVRAQAGIRKAAKKAASEAAKAEKAKAKASAKASAKAAAQASAKAAAEDTEEGDADDDVPLSEYEQARLSNISRNKRTLEEMGLLDPVLTSMRPAPKVPRKGGVRQQKSREQPPRGVQVLALRQPTPISCPR
jgi:hypothetical protein